MKKEEFARDSPLGLGWLMGHVSLGAAARALAQVKGLTLPEVANLYQISTKQHANNYLLANR